MTRLRTLTLISGAACAAAVAVAAAAPAGAAPAPSYPVGSALTGNAAWLTTPDANPPGVNVACTPSAAHPRPVVLLEGTTSRTIQSFSRLGPLLANQGYCVYGLNYGETGFTAATGGIVGAVGSIPASSQQLSGFVDSVLARTGAPKVDIVGWSQGGGPMPQYYIKYLGGAPKVNQLIGFSPSTHGTTFLGLLSLIGATQRLTGINILRGIGTQAFDDQLNTSPFTTKLNAGGDTVPGVRYTAISTRYDDVVTPYTNSLYRDPGARNIVIQNQCPLDLSDHFAMPYDNNAIQNVVNLLGPNEAGFKPSCQASLPLTGTPGLGGLSR